jgi:hypothetical protein
MKNNIYIQKQIVKMLLKAVDTIDKTTGISETILGKKKVIEITDAFKDRLEKKLRIHWNRHHEQVNKKNNNIIRLTPELKAEAKRNAIANHKLEMINKIDKEKSELTNKILGVLCFVEYGAIAYLIYKIIFWGLHS